MKFLLSSLLLLFIILPSFSSAAVVNKPNCGPADSGYKLCVPLPGQKNNTVAGLGEYVQLIYQFALAIAGIVVFGLIVYGGIVKTLSAGNVAGQEEANDIIKHAIFGLILLFLATLILYIINPNILIIKFGRSGESVKNIDFKNVPQVNKSQNNTSSPNNNGRRRIFIKDQNLQF